MRTRSTIRLLAQVMTMLRMMPIPEGVAIPSVFEHFRADGLRPPPIAVAVAPVLDELLGWTSALVAPPSPLPTLQPGAPLTG